MGLDRGDMCLDKGLCQDFERLLLKRKPTLFQRRREDIEMACCCTLFLMNTDHPARNVKTDDIDTGTHKITNTSKEWLIEKASFPILGHA